MKSTFFIFCLCFLATNYAAAQNKKIFISKHGGTKSLFTFGKIGYNLYHFTNSATNCDTLICSGAGYETCKFDKDMIKISKENGKYFSLYNKAIRATEKHARRSKKDSDQFNLIVDHKTLAIKYRNADRKGNVNIEIEVL